MLRFLQDFTFRRVGGVDDIKANVRIISATHRNLEEMVAEETFREDLFYRLNVLRIKLPALRHRKKDIPTLIEYFLEKAMKQTGRTDIKIDAQTIEKMTNYPWPGNIRELENRLFRAVVMSEGNLLNQDFLIPKNVKKEPNQASNSTDLEGFKNLKDAMKAYEENLIQQLLPLYPSTRKLASRLGVSHNTVALKLREYGIKK
jgi:TyrR family helix-turn-helix protein